MGQNSKIEWTHHTFNPWWGCEKVSQACQYCYAEAWAKRCGHDVWGGDASERRFFGDKHWDEPLKWNAEAKKAGERRRVFCASMADVFEDRPDLQRPRRRLMDLINDTPELDWLLLTKRPENIRRLMEEISLGTYGEDWDFESSMPNVWLGTTVENQDYADARIPELLKVPAKVRFLSCEPLLGPVLLDNGNCSWLSCTSRQGEDEVEAGSDVDCCEAFHSHGEHFHGIDWVICGGESGPGARPMHPDWARGLRDQCYEAGVPFLFKQWGEHAECDLGNCEADAHRFIEVDGTDSTQWSIDRHSKSTAHLVRVGKKAAGRLLDGVKHDGFPALRKDGTSV